MLLGFLHRGGIDFWTYALAADILIQDAEFIRFTSEDVDFSNRTIAAEKWIDGEWVKVQSRFPDAIRNFELRSYNKKTGDHILRSVPYSLGPTVSKFEQTELFGRIPALAKFIPETLPVDSNINIIEKIEQWGAGLLKPMRGRLGQGIIFIKTNQNNFDIEDEGNVKTISKKELEEFISKFQKDLTREYILQQFAAGTAPNGRYYNVRIVIIKSGDGDWHPCNVPMSLLAPENSIIANRDVGAKNVDLVSILNKKFDKDAKQILDKLFDASVHITRILDDSVNATAEEIALDLAIDDNGRIWLHEANWRGGIWLFEDDIGLHRHGGANLKRIALQNKSGTNIDTANAISIARKNRKKVLNSHHDLSKLKSQSLLGLQINRKSDDTISLITQAVSDKSPILAVSSLSSFRATQKAIGKAFEIIHEQIPNFTKPLIISLGSACTHNPEMEYQSHKWLQEELIDTEVITQQDLQNGFSIKPKFLQRVIKENKKDLRVNSLDIFILENLERSLDKSTNYEEEWRDASIEISDAIEDGNIKEWGFGLNESTILNNKLTVKKLLALLKKEDEVILPTTLYIQVESFDKKTIGKLISKVASLPLKLIFALPEEPLKKKNWYEPHKSTPIKLIEEYLNKALPQSIILAPISTINDLNELTNQQFKCAIPKQPWYFSNKKTRKINMPLVPKQIDKSQKEKRRQLRSLNALSRVANFDIRQYFRFFVDGRFHKSYRGWVGYEENEPGSAVGILNAYAYMLDNFDLSQGLKPSYVRQLHLLCMKNVGTKNLKSTPGELRFLEAGFNIYKKYSTINSVAEILSIRSGDGTPVFHTPGYEKTADELDAQELMNALDKKNRLKFRPWYPALNHKQKRALTKEGDLDTFYEVKHYVQRGFAQRLDNIISYYNEEISQANSSDEILLSISRVTRNIEMLHPFPDGNGRLCIAILMNHLLLYHGFLPAILFDPNIDIELSAKEFVQEIKRGIANTQILLKDPEAKLYDFSVNELSEKEHAQFKEMSKEVIKKLAPYADLNQGKQNVTIHKHAADYCYLSPKRAVDICNGTWMNANEKTVENLRFRSISIDASQSTKQQLFFFRNLNDFIKEGNDPIEYINEVSKQGVCAVVTDNMDIAKQLPLPTLYVEDLADALNSIARAVRRAVNVKTIAIAGSHGKTTIKRLLHNALEKQSAVHAQYGGDNKTPDIMSSLANLKLTDNIELTEVHVDKRANVSRYRSRVIAPHICLFPEVQGHDEKDVSDFVKAYAGMIDGLKEDGVCIINSHSSHSSLLVKMIQKEDVAVQTFGYLETDTAHIVEATLNKKEKQWNIKANILGEHIKYKVSGTQEYLPVHTIGSLLTSYNLGYDIKKAALAFK